jgi:hypothetical protein
MKAYHVRSPHHREQAAHRHPAQAASPPYTLARWKAPRGAHRKQPGRTPSVAAPSIAWSPTSSSSSAVSAHVNSSRSQSCDGSRAQTIQSDSSDSGLSCRRMGFHKFIFTILNTNSHQNSHLTKMKKATSRVASATYSFLWCLWLLR